MASSKNCTVLSSFLFFFREFTARSIQLIASLYPFIVYFLIVNRKAIVFESIKKRKKIAGRWLGTMGGRGRERDTFDAFANRILHVWLKRLT